MNILEAIFIICVLIQLFYIYVFFLSLNKPDTYKLNPTTDLPGVSVVICAHNEYKYLSENLVKVLQQDYPEFEVIVVNDGSSDESGSLLNEMSEKFTRLNIETISVEEKSHLGKKQALKLGIKTAKYKYVLLTDADCAPLSNNWIRCMAQEFGEKKDVVLGFSPGLKQEGLINAFIRFDIFNTAIQYLNFSIRGITYMGTGRNLAYQKSLVYKKDMDLHLNFIGGDDDLTINQISDSTNTAVVLNPESFVYTNTKESLNAFWKQKSRHYSVSYKYRLAHIVLLSLWSGSKLMLYILFFSLLVVNKLSFISIIFMLLYVISNTIMYFRNSKILGNRDLLLLSPVLDVLSIFFNSFVLITNLFSKKVEWN